MSLFDKIPGDFNVSLAFIMLLILFLSFYMGLRSVKRLSLFTVLTFAIQLCVLTMCVLSVLNKVIVIPVFEIALILCGVIIPLLFLFIDYGRMKKRIAMAQADAPLIEKLERKTNRNWRYQDFIEQADDWNGELQPATLTASLNLADKNIKNSLVHQIQSIHQTILSNELKTALESYAFLSNVLNDNPFIVCNTAWLYLKNSMYEEAHRFYKKALHLIENTKGQNEDEAFKDSDTLRATAHFGNGLCFYALKKYEYAIYEFKAAKQFVKDLNQADLNIARAYMATGDKEEAQKYLKAVLEKKEDSRLRYFFARILYERNFEMECKYQLESIVDKEAEFTEALDLLGKVCRKFSDWKGAVSVYRKLTRLMPQEAEYHYLLGLSLRQDGNTEEAFAAFKFASELRPDHSRALFSLASIFDAQGKFEKAIDFLHQSLEGEEKLEMAFNLLAELYISLDRVNDAVHVYEEASLEHPASYIIQYNLGVTLMMQKRHEEAVRSFKRAQKITSDDSALYYNWASAAISLKHYTEAAKLYKEGLRFKPDDDEILFGLARVSSISGDMEATMAFLSKAFAINPELKLRAKASSDFSMIRTHPEFMEITRLPVREEKKHA